MQILSLDVGGTKIFGQCFDGEKKLGTGKHVATDSIQGRERVLDNITALITELFSPKTAAISIGWAGFTDPTNGFVLHSANIPGFENFPLVKTLEAQFSVPVFLENDARLFALAEAQEKQSDFLLGIILGTGVGSGLIWHGHILSGQNGIAGEIGQAFWGGAGNETPNTLFSGPGIARIFQTTSDQNGLEKIRKNLEAKESETWEILTPWIQKLARWIVNQIVTFDPEHIVFGGSISKFFLPLFFADMEKQVRKLCLERNIPNTVKIAISTAENSGALGAAIYAREKLRDSK